MGYYDDALGTLEMGDYLGAAPRRGPFRAPPRRPSVPRAQLVPQVPGVPDAGLRLQPLGLGATAFTATSGTILPLSAQPQKPFQAQRLIVDVTRTGASATGLVTVTRIDIGADNMLAGSNPLPISMFSATSVDCNIRFAPATPGITVAVQLAISAAPTMTDRVDLSGAMLGTTYGH
jgi:hypothetical protein